MDFENLASFFCHRIPERSFDGFLFCGRCFGIYSGVVIGTILFFLSRAKRIPGIIDLIAYVVCILMMYFEILLEVLLGIEVNNEIRAFTGLSFGIGLSLLLCSAMAYFLGSENSLGNENKPWQWIISIVLACAIIPFLKKSMLLPFFNLLEIFGFVCLNLILFAMIISVIKYARGNLKSSK